MDRDPRQKLDSAAVCAVLADLLRGRRRIEFIPNPGNAGDALINAGAWQMFEQMSIAGSILRPARGVTSDTYIYPGGGNLIPQYDNGRQAILERLQLPFEMFVILPHTIRGNIDLLGRMDERFHIFCRDLLTLNHVLAHAPRAHAYLADDLALDLDLEWLQSPAKRIERGCKMALSPSCLRRYWNWRMDLAHFVPQDGVLTILRIDTEAASSERADPRLDLSARYGSYFATRGEPELVAGDFIAVLDRAEKVVTDRLHVGIGASLLGKEVVLLDNSYGKNRALFEFSMKDRFPRTTFADAVEVTN